MNDVFISYSHIDNEIAEALCELLTTEGITYFRDEKKIEWGDSISNEVKLALEESFAIIVVVSPASLKSYWVSYEIGYANAKNKRILPFLTHPSLEVPHFIKDLKYITSINQAIDYFHNKFQEEKKIPIIITYPDKVDGESKIRKAYKLIPKLLDEMKTDATSENAKLIREFMILSRKGVVVNSIKLRFIYYENEHENLRNQVDVLEDCGFVFNITIGETPLYRMSEEFIELLQNINLNSA